MGVDGAARVVAMGGGHGLAASLRSLRRVTGALTAVVTVADDGGSSGRLREELGVLPPGDLRMALAALCGDDDWGQTWSRVAQHRFRSAGALHDHAVGNLLIVALWELLGDSVQGLDWVARLLGTQGRVLPMSLVPLDIEAVVELDGELAGMSGADVREPVEGAESGAEPGTEPGAEPRAESGAEPGAEPGDDSGAGLATIRGQVAVATTPGRVVSLGLVPDRPPACPEAVAAVSAADWVVLGPGSWFTSVLPHLLVPDLAAALISSPARRVVVLNLAPQPGETAGFAPETHLEVLAAHAPDLRLDAVLAHDGAVPDPTELRRVARELGAEVVLTPLARPDEPTAHDPDLLAEAFRGLFGESVAGESAAPETAHAGGPDDRM